MSRASRSCSVDRSRVDRRSTTTSMDLTSLNKQPVSSIKIEQQKKIQRNYNNDKPNLMTTAASRRGDNSSSSSSSDGGPVSILLKNVTVNKSMIRTAVSKFGTISDIYIPKNHNTGKIYFCFFL